MLCSSPLRRFHVASQRLGHSAVTFTLDRSSNSEDPGSANTDEGIGVTVALTPKYTVIANN
jgi:hypothetical protein